MARTSYQTYLMHSNDGETYEKLVDIKDFPDMGKAGNTIDVTTLSNSMKVYLADIKDPGGALEFTANYDKDDYKRLDALANKEEYYSLWFGATTTAGVDVPDGSAGKFDFKGELSVYTKGTGVSSAVDMGVSISPSTEIKMAD